MKDAVRNIFHRCAVALSRSAFLAKVARRIADYHVGNNNPDMATNGELDFLKKHIADAHCAFDVGANKGDWTSEVLKLNSKTTVVAFEPDPAMFALFKANHFPGQVTCESKGLGEREEVRTFYVNKESPGMNSFVRRERFSDGEIVEQTVSLTTLDAYSLAHNVQKIDFMKVDVEGFELDVLRGASRMIREKKISVIQFEYGGTYLDARHTLKEAYDLLTGSGYVFYKLLPRDAMPISAWSPMLEDYEYSNYAAILT